MFRNRSNRFLRLVFGLVLIVLVAGVEWGTMPALAAQADAHVRMAPGDANTLWRFHSETPLADGWVLYAGGEDSRGNVTASAAIYDSATETWIATGSLNLARRFHAAVLMADGRVLVTGGEDSRGNVTASVEIYDPVTGTWTVTSSMVTARRNHSATLQPDGRVEVAGGEDDSGKAVSTTELYDPKGYWKIAGDTSTTSEAPLVLKQPEEELVKIQADKPGKGGESGLAPTSVQAPVIDVYVRFTNNSVLELYPAVAYNSQRGEYLVVWSEDIGGGAWGIYGQRVNTRGAKVGGLITIDTSGVNWAPAVAYNSTNDQYLVAYTFNQTSSSDYDILGKIVNGDGTIPGSWINIDIRTTKKESYPSVAYNSTDNNYLVAYQAEQTLATGDYLISGTLVTNSGSIGTRLTIASGGLARVDPDVAYNKTRNEYLAVYEREYNDGSKDDHDILGQRFSNLLVKQDAELYICADTWDQVMPSVAAGPNEYLVAWSDGLGDTPPTDYDIFGRRVAGDGTLPGVAGGSGISTSGTNNRYGPQVGYGAGFGYLATWYYNSGGSSGWDVWGRYWRPGQDEASGSEFSIDATSGGQYVLDMACASNGDCLMVEEDGYYASGEIGGWYIIPNHVYLPLLRR